jgi:GNAT superfamily N-acetyltransferase
LPGRAGSRLIGDNSSLVPRATSPAFRFLPEASIVISILPAVGTDIDDIHALIHGLADYERLSHLCTGTRDDLADALFGARPAAEVLIARDGGDVAGFALFFPTFSTFLARRGLWLEDLFVKPPMRGRGIGRALLTALAAVARERRCGRLEWAVLDWNASAIGFYEGLGATLMPDWRLARVTGDALAAMAERGAALRDN